MLLPDWGEGNLSWLNHVSKAMNEQSAMWPEILIWKCILLMKMYDAWTFVVKLCIRHVRLFYQYAYRALETERDIASATLCVAIKRSSRVLCNSATSRCSIAMHIFAHMHTYVHTCKSYDVLPPRHIY